MHSFVYTVQSTAQIAVTCGKPGHVSDQDSCLVKAPTSNTATVYVGGSDVSAANGFPLAPGDPAVGFDATSVETLYAICATASQTLRVLKKLS